MTPLNSQFDHESIEDLDRAITLCQNNLISKYGDLDWLESEAMHLQVNDLSTAEQALSMALQTRKLETKIEEYRKNLTRPHIEFQRGINKSAKELSTALKHIELQLKYKIEIWFSKDDNSYIQKPDCLSVADGTLHTKSSWQFSIENINHVPREYLKIDEEAVQNALDLGFRKIDGLQIECKRESVLRVKN